MGSSMQRLTTLAGLAGGLLVLYAVSADTSWSPLYNPDGARELFVIGLALSAAGVAVLLQRGWRVLGRAGRIVVGSVVLAVPAWIFGSWSPIGAVGWVIVCAAIATAAWGLVRAGIASRNAVLAFAAGIALTVAYGFIGVEVPILLCIPVVLVAGGWLWLFVSLWQTTPSDPTTAT